MRRIRKVTLTVSENFYRQLENSKKIDKERLGLSKISFPDYTEMIHRSGIRINLFGGKNVKLKKISKI